MSKLEADWKSAIQQVGKPALVLLPPAALDSIRGFAAGIRFDGGFLAGHYSVQQHSIL
jgi:hypothetical protein